MLSHLNDARALEAQETLSRAKDDAEEALNTWAEQMSEFLAREFVVSIVETEKNQLQKTEEVIQGKIMHFAMAVVYAHKRLS